MIFISCNFVTNVDMIMYMLVYVVLGLTVLYLYFRHKPRKGRTIPGPSGWPLVGHAFTLKRHSTHQLFDDLANQYGDMFKLKAFNKSIVVINDAAMIRSLFCDDPYRKFTNDREDTFHGQWVLFENRAIFTMLDADALKLAEQKKLLTRGMHLYGEGVKDFEANIFKELCRLKQQVESCEGQEFDMNQLLLTYLCNVISILLCGEGQYAEESNIMWEYDRHADIFFGPKTNIILTSFPFLRLVPGFYKNEFDTTMRARAALLDRYVYEAKETYRDGRVRGLVDFYLAEQRLAEEEGRPGSLTDEDICARVLETCGAGVIATLSVLTSLFLRLMNYPEYQTKIQDEIDHVIGVIATLSALTSLYLCLLNHPEYQTKIQDELDHVIGRDNHPSVSHEKDCVIIGAVILEVHRYIPVGPFGLQHFCKPSIEFQGYEIPANSTIITNVWHVHHDETIWGDPWTFRPERWIDDRGQLLDSDHPLRHNLLAFGAGRRQCVGESLSRSRMFLCVATLLQSWNFEMVPEHRVPCDPRSDNFQVEFTCRAKPYVCRAIPREH